MSTQEHSQFGLLKERRFLPFFSTQFAGAFNDNLYKNALMLFMAYSATPVLGMQSDLLLNLAAGLFILPFFLFSALAGQIADKYEKSRIIRVVKLAEIGIMLVGAYALWQGWWLVSLLLLFLMGAQSTFFGPVKYAILPQTLRNDELVGGNALVEMGTFVAILLGTLAAGILKTSDVAVNLAITGIITVSILGYLAARKIPMAAASDPGLTLRWNIWKETWRTVGYARENHNVFLSIMAISWFWFIGAAYLTQFPNFAKLTLHGDETAVTILLSAFIFGIGFGSMLCERLSGHKVEMGIVPLGSMGISLFGVDLYLSTPDLAQETVNWWFMLSDSRGWRVLLDLAGIGLFGGFFIVPLYAYVQNETVPEKRARVIAALNILNALFMVTSALAGMVFLGMMGLDIPEFFLVLAIMNLVIMTYVYQQVPDFALRFYIWMISHTMYRVKHEGFEHLPEHGAAVIVCNHVSYMDALLIGGACRRPMRFVMDSRIYRTPGMKWFFRLSKTIPIAPRSADEKTYEAAFVEIKKVLSEGGLLCIFPEGRLTTDGEIAAFRNGIERIIGETPVPVIPMALQGLWGSFFSHRDGGALTKLPRRVWSRVNIVCGAPIPASQATAPALEARVRELRGDHR